ncbi:hypothetical protein [Oceanobacillus sojae]|uniref:hypothetical protein n=1 Tax=Oceanobacillus sojae TaxID=582851 RepID=UPI0036400A17
MDNLHEIIAFILREVDIDGAPQNAKKKFNLDKKKYIEILEVMQDNEYIELHKIDYAGNPIPEHSFITRKGHALIKEYY